MTRHAVWSRVATQTLALVALLQMAASAAAMDLNASAFCVRPGDTEQDLKTKCDAASRKFVPTEGGDLIVYFVTHGTYRFDANIENGKVFLAQFNENPLPMSGVEIGQRFAEIRAVMPSAQLDASAEEEGFIALFDEERGIYLSFETDGVSPDWFGEQPFDEAEIANIRLVSVNFAGTSADRND